MSVFAVSPPAQLMLTPSSTEGYISYFFVGFLSRHQFAGSSGEDCGDLQTSAQDSPSLRCAIAALSSLCMDSSVRPSSPTSGFRTSFLYYQKAVSLLRSELGKVDDDNASTIDSTLWTTLLLSIFELMYDATGSGFNVHFVQGTSTLLQCKSPEYFLQQRKRPFLRLARALELMRAVAYWDMTYFEDARWRRAIDNTTTEGDPLSGSSALEAMYKIVGAFTNLKSSAKRTVQSTQPQDLDGEHRTLLQQTVNEAWHLQDSLHLWYSTAMSQRADRSTRYHCNEDLAEGTSGASMSEDAMICTLTTADPQLLLALLYYHALSLNIPSMFKQHPHYAYMEILAPTSTAQENQSHVSNIIMLSESALKLGTLAEMQLLWPVRAAGTHCVDIVTSDQVLEILAQVDRSGFAIARRYKADLCRHWRKNDLR